MAVDMDQHNKEVSEIVGRIGPQLDGDRNGAIIDALSILLIGVYLPAAETPEAAACDFAEVLTELHTFNDRAMARRWPLPPETLAGLPNMPAFALQSLAADDEPLDPLEVRRIEIAVVRAINGSEPQHIINAVSGVLLHILRYATGVGSLTAATKQVADGLILNAKIIVAADAEPSGAVQ